MHILSFYSSFPNKSPDALSNIQFSSYTHRQDTLCVCVYWHVFSKCDSAASSAPDGARDRSEDGGEMGVKVEALRQETDEKVGKEG